MRLLELYTTVQGEGPNVGKRTTFVRFAGCNYRCPGWPCDTPYSIEPSRWKTEYEEVAPEDLFKRVDVLDPTHVCITGGEPLIQPRDQLQKFIKQLREFGYTIDIFTNGSRDLEKILPARDGVTVVMDWKLTGSGEGESDLDTRIYNLEYLGFRDALKFVVKDETDLHEMRKIILGLPINPYRIYVSPAWGLIEPAKIVEFLQQYNLNIYLNVQVHKYVWDPDQRRI